MLTKLIDIDDALNVVEMIIMRLTDQSQWKRLSDLARRELDAIPESENAVISDISNIVVGTIESVVMPNPTNGEIFHYDEAIYKPYSEISVGDY